MCQTISQGIHDVRLLSLDTAGLSEADQISYCPSTPRVCPKLIKSPPLIGMRLPLRNLLVSIQVPTQGFSHMLAFRQSAHQRVYIIHYHDSRTWSNFYLPNNSIR